MLSAPSEEPTVAEAEQRPADCMKVASSASWKLSRANLPRSARVQSCPTIATSSETDRSLLQELSFGAAVVHTRAKFGH